MYIWVKNYRINLDKVLYVKHFEDFFEIEYESKTILISTTAMSEPDICLNSIEFSRLHKALDKAMKPCVTI